MLKLLTIVTRVLLLVVLVAPSVAQPVRVPVQPPESERDWINVRRDFGAVGDGVTDDTRAFANAIAAFASSRSAAYVLVPPGTYVVDSIQAVSDLHLMGAGKSRTIIRARNPGVGAGIVRQTGLHVVQQLIVEQMQFVGFQHGIDARAVYYSEFRSLYLLNCSTGIYLGRRNASEGLSITDRFTDIRVVDSTEWTMDVDVSVPGDLVNHCQFHNCYFETARTPRAIRFRGQGGNGLTGNSFHGCALEGSILALSGCSGIGWYGGYVEGASIDVGSGVKGLTVSGTYFQVAAGSGIRIGVTAGQPAHGVTIDACTFASTSPAGIGIEVRPDIGAGSTEIMILGNAYLPPIIPVQDNGGHAARVLTGRALPNGSIASSPGAIYLRTTGGAQSTLWIKESGLGSSGWIAK